MSDHPLRVRVASAVAGGFALAAVLSGCSHIQPLPVKPIVLAAVPAVVPTVTGMSAAGGSLSGGEIVSVYGNYLGAVDRVSFGGQDAPSVVVVNPTRVDVVVPSSHTFVEGPVPVAIYMTKRSAPIAEETRLEYGYRAQSAVDHQLEYAFAHWNNYNLQQYGDFTSWGGDCMNFVSQTLVARGWALTADWYNDAQEDWAPPFVAASNFNDYLDASPELGAARLTLSERNRVKIGDLAMFDWDDDGFTDHAQVVSAVAVVNNVTRIWLVGHDIDTNFRDVDEALATEGEPGATVFFWSLPA